MSRGGLFVICSPSGGGKTTIIRGVIEVMAAQNRPAHFSVSHTTRAPRCGETDGVDYHFVDRATFEDMTARDEFLEHAEYVGNLYGTSRAEVVRRLEAGCDVFLDIDVQGARQIKAILPEAVQVFVLPPSLAELRRRLLARGKDAPEAVVRRIKHACNEMREWSRFDYAIINVRLEEAIRALGSIVDTSRLRTFRRAPEVEAIIRDFEASVEEA